MDKALNSIKNSKYKYDEKDAILWENKEFIIQALEIDKCYLNYVSKELRNNREFILEAVKKYGLSLYFASEELRNDKKLVLVAFKNIHFVNHNRFNINSHKMIYDPKNLKITFKKILEFY